MQTRKRILKTSLQGIAELHDRDIVHLGKSYTQLNCWQGRSCMADLPQISSLTT
jgi:hypothetical protein